MRGWAALLPLVSVACGGSPPVIVPSPGTTPSGCGYPAGAVEPMTLGEPLAPYTWPLALDADRTPRTLNLLEAHCAEDPDYDWAPYDRLFFVSLPAW